MPVWQDVSEDSSTYYNVEISETGQSTLFIFQDSISSLNQGDEIGVFDLNGYIDTNGNQGEILVGAGIWHGTQLEIIGIMGTDLSSFGGPILPGAIEVNPLVIKIAKNSEQIFTEFDAEFDIFTGAGIFHVLFPLARAILCMIVFHVSVSGPPKL